MVMLLLLCIFIVVSLHWNVYTCTEQPSMVRCVYFKFTVLCGCSVSSTLPTGQLSNIPWRRSGVKYTSNEIFLDLIEEVDAIIDRSVSFIPTAWSWGLSHLVLHECCFVCLFVCLFVCVAGNHCLAEIQGRVSLCILVVIIFI